MDRAAKNKFQRNERLQRFRPVQTAIAGGNILMLSSGIHIGHGLFHWESVDVEWKRGASAELIYFIAITWFMGSIAGFILAPRALQMINSRSAYLASNFLVATSAVILISAPGDYFALFFARFLAGVGHGLCYVTLVKHFGEICDDKYRGKFGTALHLFLLKGGVISGTLLMNFFSQADRMDPNRFIGICSLSLSAIAILMTLTFYKESILTLLEEGREEEAVETLKVLRGQKEETPKISRTVEEHKAMIIEDMDKTSGIFQDGNARPLIVVTFLRVAFVLTFNYALKHTHISMTATSQSGFDSTLILNIIHAVTTFVVMFTIDKGRRIHFILSATITTIVFIALAASRSTIYANNNLVVFILFVTLQLFGAIFFGPSAHIYSAEAFPAPKKTASIAFTSIWEHFAQIIFIILVSKKGSSEAFDVVLLSSSGAVLGLISVCLYYWLPDTSKLSLREAKNKFL